MRASLKSLMFVSSAKEYRHPITGRSNVPRGLLWMAHSSQGSLDTILPAGVLSAPEHVRFRQDGACAEMLLLCLAKEGAMDLSRWLNDERLLANLIGIHVVLAVVLLVSIVLRKLLKNGGDQFARWTACHWLEGASKEAVKSMRSMLFWTT